MKKTYHLLTFLFCIVVLSACEKNAVQKLPEGSPGAQIKFFNFAPNSPSVNFFANTDKISGTLTASGIVSTTGVNYGSVFPASNYASLKAGSYAFKGQIPESATVDANLAITNLQSSIDVGKFYSLYTCGIYNSTAKTTDAFIVEDVLPTADTSAAYVRLVNSVSNSNTFSLVLKNLIGIEGIIATGVAYKSGSTFVKVPEGIYDLYARYSPSTTNVITRTGVSFLKGRVYTISARGDMTVTSTTATNRPFFDNTQNR
ncbi:MAG: DUF4397 domain-containing protein [Oligoflexus sp.]|nr:DUF4397 domain-containing protein [Pseudopedobacter sp.]